MIYEPAAITPVLDCMHAAVLRSVKFLPSLPSLPLSSLHFLQGHKNYFFNLITTDTYKDGCFTILPPTPAEFPPLQLPPYVGQTKEKY